MEWTVSEMLLFFYSSSRSLAISLSLHPFYATIFRVCLFCGSVFCHFVQAGCKRNGFRAVMLACYGVQAKSAGGTTSKKQTKKRLPFRTEILDSFGRKSKFYEMSPRHGDSGSVIR